MQVQAATPARLTLVRPRPTALVALACVLAIVAAADLHLAAMLAPAGEQAVAARSQGAAPVLAASPRRPVAATRRARRAAAPGAAFDADAARRLKKLVRHYHGTSHSQFGVAVANLESAPGATKPLLREFGGIRSGATWSAIKVPIAMAFLGSKARGRGGGSKRLSARERTLLSLMIRESDNKAASTLFKATPNASARIERIFRRSHAGHVSVSPKFGTTVWKLRAAVAVDRAMMRGKLLRSSDKRYMLGLMRTISGRDSWGLGASFAHVPVAFKGGWGPQSSGGGWLVEQVGIVGKPRSGYAVAIMIHASSFDAGKSQITQVAKLIDRATTRHGRPSPPAP